LNAIDAVPSTLAVELVRDLGSLDAGMLADVGGKAANLGELSRAGLPVPPGFCLTTQAYRRVAAAAGLDDVLDELAATAASDVPALARLAGRVRESVLTAPVPEEILEAVREAYRRLGGRTPVAVRSSATAEDLPSASFAGQQDTYLNVIGGRAVLDAVRRCWASLWTDRAVAYRATNGIDHRDVQLAVVVQPMIDVAVAGVLFTADPVTGKRRQAVVDASPGLGEAVVSGAVNPDRFVVDATSGTIVERRLGDKQLMIVPRPGGGTERVGRPPAPDQPCLTDAQLRELAGLGRRVEELYGAPQDIEWAIDTDGRAWLTQARPITTLFPQPTNAPARGDGIRVYFCFTLAQGLERPITPMGVAAFRLIASSAAELFGMPAADPYAGPPAFAEAGQRLFIDVTTIVRSKIGRMLAPRVLDLMEARSAVLMRSLFDDPRLSVAHKSPWPFLRRVLRLWVRFRMPVYGLQALVSPAAAHRRVERVGQRLAKNIAPPPSLTPEQRLDHAERILRRHVFPMAPTVAPSAVPGFVLLGLVVGLLEDSLEPGQVLTVLRSLPHNVTTEMDLQLWQLASRLRADPAVAALMTQRSPRELAHQYRQAVLPELAQRGLAHFLDRWGHRAVAEIDIGMPRWSEDPTHVIGVLANYLRLGDGRLAPDAQFARGAAEAAAMVDRLVAKARRLGRWRAPVVRFGLRRARQLGGLREMPKYYIVTALAEVRRQIVAVGAHLADNGGLDSPDDIFFLNLVEARAALAGTELRGQVAQRREAYRQELRRRQVPRILLSDGTQPQAPGTATVAADALAGIPASSGVVTAPARVVLDPVGARLEPGEVLVAPSTDPGWTPLFLTAGGLVMEMGGANSHGAVVAREYGIPAVVGVPDAVSRIATGQLITVDGARGVVTLSDHETHPERRSQG
jgi:phosphohistidine swiveling domain-containing protein